MDIVLWGATGQAIVLAELYRRSGHPVVALFDNDESATSPLEGVAIYHGASGFAQWLQRRGSADGLLALAAIGGSRGRDRLAIHRLFEESGVTIATAVDPGAFVASDAQVGKGSQILAMAAVASRAVIGQACIVNTSASVDHECELEDGAHIGPGATLAGRVTIESCAFVGAGATILPRIRVGRDSIVGAGSVVTADVATGQVVAGNPARTLRKV